MDTTSQHYPVDAWPEGEVATATDFVRHFGHYAATSRVKPIYIAQHGRVGWALLSAAEMTRLTMTDSGNSSTDARFDILIDSLSTIVIIIGPDFQILRMNSAANRHFQIAESAQCPLNFVELLKDNNREFFADTCTRVLKSGDAEAFDLESGRYPGRTLHFQIIAFPGGVLILADAVSATTNIRSQLAGSLASDTAIDTAALLGRGRINVRETITIVNDNLIRLTGSERNAIVGLRLWEVFEHGSRNQVRTALDLLLTKGQPFSAKGLMLKCSGKNVPVTIGVAPERDTASITGAAFVIVPHLQVA